MNQPDKVLMIKPDFLVPPMGIAYVLASLEEHHIPVEVIDVSCTPNYQECIREKLKKERYLAVASGGLIGYYDFFQKLAQLVKRHQPETSFVLGGNITKDADDKLLFDYIKIDYGVIGEAETSFPGFLTGLREGVKDFTGYPGIIFKNATGEVIRNKPVRYRLKDSNLIPAWHYFNMKHYIRGSQTGEKEMHVIPGRGCIAKCGFCSPTIGGFQKRPVEKVIDEIKYLLKTYEFDTLYLMNEMFYPLEKDVIEFCNAYKRIENRVPWHTQLRVDTELSDETFALMRESGCRMLYAGIESYTARMLEIMNKRITPSQITHFFRKAKKAGIPTRGFILFGYENETPDDIKETIDQIIQEDLSITNFFILFLYPGTQVYDNALAAGKITDPSKHYRPSPELRLYCPSARYHFCNTTNMSTDEFFRIAPREVSRYYTHAFNRYPVTDLSVSRKGYKLTTEGCCPHCGQRTAMTVKIYNPKTGILLGFLGEGRTICQKCFNPVGYNFFQAKNIPSLNDHFLEIGKKLSQYQRIVMCGANTDTIFLMRINLFNLNYDNIKGLYDSSASYHYAKYFSYDVLDLEQLVKLEPDCLLWLDYPRCPSSITRAFTAKGIKVPDIITLYNQEAEKLLMPSGAKYAIVRPLAVMAKRFKMKRSEKSVPSE